MSSKDEADSLRDSSDASLIYSKNFMAESLTWVMLPVQTVALGAPSVKVALMKPDMKL